MDDGASFEPTDPSRYTVEFTSNGRVVVRADCNRGTGAYTLRGHTITLTPVAVTRRCARRGRLTNGL